MTGLINWFSQIISVTAFGIQSLPKRLGSSLTAMLGIAGVVAVKHTEIGEWVRASV